MREFDQNLFKQVETFSLISAEQKDGEWSLKALKQENVTTVSAESWSIFAPQVTEQKIIAGRLYQKAQTGLSTPGGSSHIAAANVRLTNTFTKIISLAKRTALLLYTLTIFMSILAMLTLSQNIHLTHLAEDLR